MKEDLKQRGDRRRIGRMALAFLLACCLPLTATIPCWGAVFHDALGRAVVLRSPPTRIVSLAPNITEILYYLGLGDRVAGVTRYSYYPPQALKKPRVGSYVRANAEKILALKPDLVLATMDGNSAYTIGVLERAGIPVYVVNPRTVRETIATVARIADVAGIKTEGARLAGLLSGRLEKIIRKTAGLERPKVFVQINIRPIMTVNKHTIHNDVIRLAGGMNMTGDLPVTYPRISREEVLAEKPDVIIVSCMERGGRFEKAREEWLKWPSIPAVRNRRVFLVDSDLIDRPSPRIIRGLEIMAEHIHPEVDWHGDRGAENRDSSR